MVVFVRRKKGALHIFDQPSVSSIATGSSTSLPLPHLLVKKISVRTVVAKLCCHVGRLVTVYYSRVSQSHLFCFQPACSRLQQPRFNRPVAYMEPSSCSFVDAMCEVDATGARCELSEPVSLSARDCFIALQPLVHCHKELVFALLLTMATQVRTWSRCACMCVILVLRMGIVRVKPLAEGGGTLAG